MLLILVLLHAQVADTVVAGAAVTLVAETRRPPMVSGVDTLRVMEAEAAVVGVVAPTLMWMTNQLSLHWVRQLHSMQGGAKHAQQFSLDYMTGGVP